MRWIQDGLGQFTGTRIDLPRVGVCENVRAYCDALGKPVTRLSPGMTVTRELPRTVEAELDPGFGIRLSRDLPERYLAQLDKPLLTSAKGMVILPNGELALELVHNDSRRLAEFPFMQNGLRGPVQKKKGDYFSIFVFWAEGKNYYHWIHDAVMRLYQVLERLPAGTRFIVPAQLPAYKRDSLQLLGIPSERLLPFDGSEIWELERLHFTPPLVHTGNDHPLADVWYREAMWERVGIRAPNPHRRIYISRRHSNHRRFTNEAEVVEILEQHGFETCYAEQLAFRDQVALFAQAQVVVGCHGAGFTNVLFSKPGARVLDVQDPNYRNFAFWNMCEAVGHRYWYFLGDELRVQGAHHEFRCPPDKLHLTLQELLEDWE